MCRQLTLLRTVRRFDRNWVSCSWGDGNDAVVVFITGQLTSSVADFNAGMSISSWGSATEQPVFERGDADGIAAGVVMLSLNLPVPTGMCNG